MTKKAGGIHRTVVTGATGAIGSAIARQMAEHDFEVILVARNQEKAERLAQDIQRRTGNQRVSVALCDLSRRHSIEDLASTIEAPIKVLINNAGTTPRKRTETPEGIEMQFATNVLGYFWMTRSFLPHMSGLEDARIVNVASHWAGDLKLDDLEFQRRPYDNNTAYRQSKQANRMLTVAFADRLAPSGITVNSCHPGNVKSSLSNNLGFGGYESPDEGADTPVWLAVDRGLEGETGGFYSGRRRVRCPFGEDREAVEALYERCLEYGT